LDKYYTITELTREFGISTRTLAFLRGRGSDPSLSAAVVRACSVIADRRLIQEILRGRRIGFTIAEIREIIQVYRDPPGEAGQLRLLMRKIEEKREDLRQKRKDIEDTLVELDNIEESCLTRLAEIGVNT
jgi:DNA-binding transcriptional MerR regulator